VKANKVELSVIPNIYQKQWLLLKDCYRWFTAILLYTIHTRPLLVQTS
jgi:hypothetical protein